MAVATGFHSQFNAKMLSNALGLGLDTYGLLFILKDLLESNLLFKERECEYICFVVIRTWPYLTISLLVYGVVEFTDEMTSLAQELIASFGQKNSSKAVGRFGGSMDKTDCSRIFRAKKHKILEDD
jgi:hypothetical protein